MRSFSWEGAPFGVFERNIEGFTDELFVEIAGAEEMHLIVGVSYSNQLVALLDQEQVDAVISSLAPTPQTLSTYDFSEPFFTWGPVLVVAKNSPFTTLSDLFEKEVAFERGTFASFEQPVWQNVFLRPYSSIPVAISDLDIGNVDGVIVDSLEEHQLSQGLYANRLRVISSPLRPSALRLVAKKGKSRALLASFNAGLKKLHQNGIYDKTLLYWNLVDAVELEKDSAHYAK